MKVKITLLILFGGGGGGYIFTMLTSPKKPSRFPLLQSMEFVVAISNTDWCIQIMKDTDDFVDIMKMLLLLKKVSLVLTHHVEEQTSQQNPSFITTENVATTFCSRST